MYDTIVWVVYWSGWWAVIVVLSAIDISKKNNNLHDCWWPCGVLVGWTWPIALAAYVLIYLPAKGIHRWIR
jgi:hypothetical protein